ncbi:PAS domain-containing protein, partial [candidate division KSB1 bacterium]
MHQIKFKKKIYNELFEQVPMNIAVIDKKYNIVTANRNFRSKFGDWMEKKCYAVYKNQDKPCEKCMAALTFKDGQSHVDDELGEDRNGKPARYVIHTAPIKNDDGTIPYVIEMSTDVTEIKHLQQNYHVLFERVPCYIAVINRDFRIIRANEKFRETFGEAIGKKCYRVYKKRNKKCRNCTAEKTFKDGSEHQSEQVGITKDGKQNYYVVNTAPLARRGGEFAHVIE